LGESKEGDQPISYQLLWLMLTVTLHKIRLTRKDKDVEALASSFSKRLWLLWLSGGFT